MCFTHDKNCFALVVSRVPTNFDAKLGEVQNSDRFFQMKSFCTELQAVSRSFKHFFLHRCSNQYSNTSNIQHPTVEQKNRGIPLQNLRISNKITGVLQGMTVEVEAGPAARTSTSQTVDFNMILL